MHIFGLNFVFERVYYWSSLLHNYRQTNYTSICTVYEIFDLYQQRRNAFYPRKCSFLWLVITFDVNQCFNDKPWRTILETAVVTFFTQFRTSLHAAGCPILSPVLTLVDRPRRRLLSLHDGCL